MAGSSSSLVALVFLLAAAAAATAAPFPEKETHMRLYWHDIVSSNSSEATVVTVAQASNSTSSSSTTLPFGSVNVIDDPLTLGPNRTTSKTIGRAQGMYISVSKEKTSSVMMAQNFVFIEEPYNGSSIAIFGPNFIEKKVREMSIIGGTGVFRFARGYVEIETYGGTDTEAIVQYDIYVRH